MSTVWIEIELQSELANFTLPKGVQRRLQFLLDRQDQGIELTSEERKEAEGLVDLAEWLSLVKLKATANSDLDGFLKYWRGCVLINEAAIRDVVPHGNQPDLPEDALEPDDEGSNSTSDARKTRYRIYSVPQKGFIAQLDGEPGSYDREVDRMLEAGVPVFDECPWFWRKSSDELSM